MTYYLDREAEATSHEYLSIRVLVRRNEMKYNGVESHHNIIIWKINIIILSLFLSLDTTHKHAYIISNYHRTHIVVGFEPFIF